MEKEIKKQKKIVGQRDPWSRKERQGLGGSLLCYCYNIDVITKGLTYGIRHSK